MRRFPSSGFVLVNTVLTASKVVGFEAFFHRNRHPKTSSLYYSKMSGKSSKNEIESAINHVSDDLIPSFMRKERTRVLTKDIKVLNNKGKAVYYWMQRDMRVIDNWALLFGEHLAKEQNLPLKVLYVLPPVVPKSSDEYPSKVCEMRMTERHGHFLIGGLKVVEKELREKNVSFEVLKPKQHAEVGNFVHRSTKDATAVICDMSPLRQYREWMEDQAAPLFDISHIPLIQVDAHNVVPVWHASPKREVGARTLRPKINKLLPDYMTHYPAFKGNTGDTTLSKLVDWDECAKFLNMDSTVGAVRWAQPGHLAAMERFNQFCTSKSEGLKNFDTLRNDPNYSNVCSNLSPWINYGHVSFQRLALEVRGLKTHPNGTASYIEEGIVRRELSDNFVYYSQSNYDDISCAAEWAQESLEIHSSDEREYLYNLSQFVNAQTHDDLWNAAQIQLVVEGKMHGFLRMYWAKKDSRMDSNTVRSSTHRPLFE